MGQRRGGRRRRLAEVITPLQPWLPPVTQSEVSSLGCSLVQELHPKARLAFPPFIHRIATSTGSALCRLGICFSVATLQLYCWLSQPLLSHRLLRASGGNWASTLFSITELLNLDGSCLPFTVLTDCVLQLFEISEVLYCHGQALPMT